MFIKKQRMIELQNINLRLRAGGNVKKRNWYLILGMLLLVQLIAIFYFGSKKAGFHYDEYYSYYSSNVSIGLVPTDREWKPGSEIVDEFRVLSGQRFQYGTVTRMQTYDVHPPFYYLLLHTVCSLFPGRFSKWSGIGLNIVLFVLSWSVLTGLTCASMLFGCGSKNDTVETVPVAEVQESTAAPAETESETETETVEEDVPPEEGMVKSDLTGEWISGDLADQRPIAVMIPDENAALPHYGLSNADILYECSVEGNMTRLMAVFKDWKNIERIGNIRSCRDYYVYWAKEWDAIYCHIGGPFYILNAINDPTTNNITGAVLASDPSQKKGLYDAPFYRTSDRKAPHNAYTSGDRIDKAAQALGYSETYTENYQSDHFKFASTNNPNTLEQYGSSAIPATKIDLAGAYPITKTYFEYNEEDGLYYRFQGMQKGDQKHMDGANNKQLAFKNVLVQFAYYETRDAKGYLSFQCHDDTKDGYYFTNGKGIHVTWKKTSDFAPTKFYDDNGNEIEINPGKTNICVVEQGKSIDAE